MKRSIEDLLHPRIAKSSLSRYSSGYYKDAAREAMTQVEQAIKEKSGVADKYGASLVATVFGSGSGIKLRVPFGPHLQSDAEALLRAAFSYYRNYAVHEGDKIDEMICLRIFILASELLYLIGASALSYADVGGVRGLVTQGIFSSVDKLSELLSFLDGYRLPDEVCDGFYGDLSERGFTEKHVQALTELGLVEYSVVSNADDPSGLTDTLGCFDLAPLDKKVLSELSACEQPASPLAYAPAAQPPHR